MVPAGLRTTGGVCAAPTGSVASVAVAQASRQAEGSSVDCLSGGTPACRRERAWSMVHVWYAGIVEEEPPGGGEVGIQPGAYKTALRTLSGCSLAYEPMSAAPRDQPMRLS